MHWYIDHLYGNLYSSIDYLDYDDIYCEECGDSDTYLGYFESEEEAEKAYREYFDLDDCEEAEENL